MLPSMMRRQEFTRKRYPRVMDHGTMVVDTTATPTEATYKGSIQPGTGETDLVNRDGAEIVYTIFALPEADVRRYDIITLATGDYQVEGEPERWGTGILDHQLIRLSAWAG